MQVYVRVTCMRAIKRLKSSGGVTMFHCQLQMALHVGFNLKFSL